MLQMLLQKKFINLLGSKVEIKNINTIYFLGIGGIGMSALARYLKHQGKTVFGYDKTPTPLIKQLIEEGIEIHFDENPDRFGSVPDLVVITPAIPKDHKELIWLQENKAHIVKRSELLGIITKEIYTIGVAGTHGKTTISSIIAHMLRISGKDPLAFIGGITKNYNSNLLLSDTNKIAVVEADEFDRSFLTLFPEIAVVSAMDADHLDVYGDKEHLCESFFMFINQVKPDGTLVIKSGLPFPDKLPKSVITYGFEATATVHATNIKVTQGKYYYDVCNGNDLLFSVKAGVPGDHNILNSLAAIAVGIVLKIPAALMKKTIETYSGVQRRFDYRINDSELVYIDDYAHHPEEIKAFLGSVKQLYPDKKITGIFQPHLFSRTRDFADEFAASLSMLDEVILLDIYPARELPIKGIDSKMLLDKIKNVSRKDLYSKDELIEKLVGRNLQVLLTIGAGDIDQLVLPIEKTLNNFLKIYKL